MIDEIKKKMKNVTLLSRYKNNWSLISKKKNKLID
jgi:hypothetical protein